MLLEEQNLIIIKHCLNDQLKLLKHTSTIKLLGFRSQYILTKKIIGSVHAGTRVVAIKESYIIKNSVLDQLKGEKF